nr:isochorismatase family protein [Mycolicibacterium wolinskyi]
MPGPAAPGRARLQPQRQDLRHRPRRCRHRARHPGATLLPEFGPEPTDLVLSRWHGLGPMGGTDLDPILRNLGVTTIVAVGVSVNVAIINLVMDAVNAGYRVVLPRDAVAGIPTAYADAVIDNTLALLATVTTTDELLQAWQR